MGILLRAWITLSGHWYWDDYVFMGRAARLGLDMDYLLHTHDGHLMPSGFLLQWWLTRSLGMSFPLPAVLLLLGQSVVLVLFARLALELIGSRWAATMAIVVLALTPLTFPASTWWASALNSVPLQIGLCAGLLATVRWVRTGLARHGWTMVAVTVASLTFFEKAVLIPVACLLLLPTLLPGLGVVRAVRTGLGLGRAVWLATAGVVALYAVGYLVVSDRAPGQSFDVAAWLDMLGRGVAATLAPGLLGGPWQWEAVGYGSAIGRPPFIGAVLALELLAALVLVSAMRSRRALRAWVWAGSYVLMSLTLVAVGRGGSAVNPAIVQGTRYLADSAIPAALALGVALTVVAPMVSRAARRVAALGALPEASLHAVLVWVAIGLLLASSSVSLAGYREIWRANPSRGYVATAQASVARADADTVLLDQPVPQDVLYGLSRPYNQASWFMAPFDPAPLFDRQTRDLQTFTDSGALVPAVVDGPGNMPGPDQGCGYRIRGTNSRIIRMQADVIPFEHTMRIGYAATSATRILVRIGLGEPVVVHLERGVNAVFVRLEGGGRYVELRGTDPRVSICTDEVTVGAVAPIGQGGA